MILPWGRVNEANIPILVATAQDYLAITATSAPIKQAFSHGDLIGTKRACLKDETMEAYLCLKSWLELKD